MIILSISVSEINTMTYIAVIIYINVCLSVILDSL
jgi:hypothetical protein